MLLLPMIATSVSRVLLCPLALPRSERWRTHVSWSSSGNSSSSSSATLHHGKLRQRHSNMRRRSMVNGWGRSRFFLQCLVEPNAEILGRHNRQLPWQTSQNAKLCFFRVWPDDESWVYVRKWSAVGGQERVLAVRFWLQCRWR